MIYQDQTGRIFELNKTPERIISLVPSQSELLVDIGLRKALVGVTKFCEHPHGLKKVKTVVGGTKHIHLNRIKALQPDIILCNKEENTREMVNELEKIAPVHVSDVKTIEDNLELIGQYGTLFESKQKSANLIAEIRHVRSQFKSTLEKTFVKKVLYLIWKAPWMAVGNDTFIHEMMEENKFVNYLKDSPRYPEVALHRINEEEAPDLILLSSEPFPFKNKDKEELARIFPGSRILLVDGTFFSWFGSRPAIAYNYFARLQKQLNSF